MTRKSAAPERGILSGAALLCRKSSPAAIFSGAVRLLRLRLPSGGRRRKETLLRKASESTAHVAGFGIQLGGLRPSEPPKRLF